jgi:molybdate transport system regulatory protein
VRLRYKLWIEHESLGKAFGDGPLEILDRVDASGSLSRAAEDMGMSYSHAWNLVRRLERALGFSLLERQPGGGQGGGSAVTPMAREIMRRYRAFREEAAKSLQGLYHEAFDGFDWPELR